MPHIITILLFLGLSCNWPPAPQRAVSEATAVPLDTVPMPIFSRPDRTYLDSRAEVERTRKTLKKGYDAGLISADSVGSAFTNSLLAEVVPHWHGTSWSFTGHTETPGQGEIACGYFVSTTLLHTGLNINRYRLAQQSPSDEALMLSLGDTVRVTRRETGAKALEFWRSHLREGLYFIGLGEGHVGYLLKQRTGLYFIHANYTYPHGRANAAGRRKRFGRISRFLPRQHYPQPASDGILDARQKNPAAE
jgi:hypothetical protein